jgi:hypothetical protein
MISSFSVLGAYWPTHASRSRFGRDEIHSRFGRDEIQM